MRSTTVWTTLVCCALFAFGIGTWNVTATQDQEPAAECAVTLTPDTVAVSGEPTTVEAELAESIGAVTDVEAPPESGLRVLEISAEESRAISLELDTSTAVAGTWNLVFEGEAGSCSASLSVESA